MMILFGTAARADVLHILAHRAPSTPPFTPALAASLALPQHQVSQEASYLRTTLDRIHRQHRAVVRAGRRWSKARASGTRSSGTPTPTWTADWYAIAACESSGRWALNTGNGFYGGLQFTLSTWLAYGGGPFDGVGPFPYSAGQQIAVAERVMSGQGPGAWPNCFRWA
jgi:Transglycosylase-like domain